MSISRSRRTPLLLELVLNCKSLEIVSVCESKRRASLIFWADLRRVSGQRAARRRRNLSPTTKMPGEITRRLVKSNGEGKKIFMWALLACGRRSQLTRSPRTGGASGLGAESALACARAGASAIILTDLPAQKSKAEALAEQILAEAPGTKVLFYEHDVTKEPEWEKVFEQVHEAVGPIDVLLNSAGIGIGHQVLEDLPLEVRRLFERIRICRSTDRNLSLTSHFYLGLAKMY